MDQRALTFEESNSTVPYTQGVKIVIILNTCTRSVRETVSSVSSPKQPTVLILWCTIWRSNGQRGTSPCLVIWWEMVKNLFTHISKSKLDIKIRMIKNICLGPREVREVMHQFENGTKTCPCHPSCKEELYPATVTSKIWPSSKYQVNILSNEMSTQLDFLLRQLLPRHMELTTTQRTI